MTSRRLDPKRFEVSKSTLYFDKFMVYFIKVGGIGVIAAIFGIFVFILAQIIPLFQSAEVKSVGHLPLPEGKNYVSLGMDEWGQLPFLIQSNGQLDFISLKKNEEAEYERDSNGTIQLGEKGIFTKETVQFESKVSQIQYNAFDNVLLLGSAQGEVAVVNINYKASFEDDKRSIGVSVKPEKIQKIGSGGSIKEIEFFQSDKFRMIACIQESGKGAELHIKTYKAKKSLFGKAKLKPYKDYQLDHLIEGTPEQLLISGIGDSLFVSTKEGKIFFLRMDDGEFVVQQTIKPFSDQPTSNIVSMEWLLGGISMSLTSDSGVNRIFSLHRDEELGKLQYLQIKELPSMGSQPTLFDSSKRNRAYLLGAGSNVSLRYATTEAVRWNSQLDFKPDLGIISPKYDKLVFLDPASKLHFYDLNDPHPEAGVKAFFGKIWYEGQSQPEYSWQSTGAESSFEAKLSMIPLIWGSLKGTFYAILFALPISVMAAIYTSQFLNPKIKKYVKPTMEIMASLPSVVLGFMAALWLAPLLEDKVPSLILTIIAIPSSAVLVGTLYGRLPKSIRVKIRVGYEFLILIPILLIVGFVFWNLGPVIESLCFTVQDPVSGEITGNFPQWWNEVTGTSFEQRNSLVVGFIMGFAVIPIIFTIAEDAMSNVPAYLTSASLALGASRWQTASRIVLPTASAGIFSGVMIGLGRAVGETMIVVMATGNTPIMEWNIFSGMRTLAANIAVELPEAPHHGTLYRTLFLGAMVLFLLTFLVNTIAEITRQRLRDKYKTVS